MKLFEFKKFFYLFETLWISHAYIRRGDVRKIEKNQFAPIGYITSPVGKIA
jgi:hypothetical protein